MASTILVTGATGTVGSEVVKQLSAAGANVRAAVQATSDIEEVTGRNPISFEQFARDYVEAFK